MSEAKDLGNFELPAIIEQAAASVPETWRQKAALTVFKIIAGSAGPGVAKARDSWAMMNARERVTSALAEEVAKRAVADPQIMDRAMSHMIAEEFKSQENRESVSRIALEDLSEPAPNEDQAGEGKDPLDEDWITKFSRYAEQVSNIDMQRMWARVLAGEVRKPGSYSFRTLRFLSDMDQRTGEVFQDLARHNLANNALFLLPEQYNSGPNHRKITTLLDAGLIVERPGTTNRPAGISKDGDVSIYYGVDLALLIKPAVSINIPIVQLSTVGRELLRLIPPANDFEILKDLAEYIRKRASKVSSAVIAKQVSEGDIIKFIPISSI